MLVVYLMTKIFILSFALIFHYFYLQNLKPLSFYQFAGSKLKIELNHPDKRVVSLWRGLLLGDLKKISAKDKEIIQKLGLRHILTPSGLHLGMLTHFWLKFIPSKFIKILVFFLIYLFIHTYLPNLFAFKRMCLLKILLTGLKDRYQSFWLVQGFFLFGIFSPLAQTSTLSYLLSYFFISICYYPMNSIKKYFIFFGAQIVISYIFNQSLFLAALIISPLLVLIFSLNLPALIVSLIFQNEFLIEVNAYLTQSILSIMDLLMSNQRFLISFKPDLGMIILGGLVLKTKSTLVLLFALILYSSNLNIQEAVKKKNELLRKYISSELEFKSF